MYHPIDMHVGKRIRFKRKMLGLTQSDLGEMVDLTFQQIQKYEKGENRVSASKLFQISQALHTSVGFFFEDYVADSARDAKESSEIGFLDDKQALDLVQSFSTIKNPKLQKRIKMLIDSMSDEG